MIYAITVIEKIIVSLLLILVLGIAPITKPHELQEKRQIQNNVTSTTVADAGTKESQDKKGKRA